MRKQWVASIIKAVDNLHDLRKIFKATRSFNYRRKETRRFIVGINQLRLKSIYTSNSGDKLQAGPLLPGSRYRARNYVINIIQEVIALDCRVKYESNANNTSAVLAFSP